MAISRRNILKIGAAGAVAAAATTLTGCNASGEAVKPDTSTGARQGTIVGKHQVVVIGGGFGGLTVAKRLKKHDEKFEVLVIEKNDTFMACPFSNAYLGKLKDVNLGTFIFDYAQPIEKNGYSMLKAEVTGIDRAKKLVYTTCGAVAYEILVLSPGIAYNYEAQFPTWSKEKIKHIHRVAPPALIPGSEHVILERNLANMEDGDVIITVPAGKFRCPPAPFERASMIAAFMKKEDIRGKVIILNETAEIAKGAAFKESWSELYGNRVEHHANCKIADVDTAKKTITYEQTVGTGKKDEDGDEIMTKVSHTRTYEVLNLIAYNRSSPVVEMAGLATTEDNFHKVKMAGCTFQTATDADVYAIGDIVGHAIPPSGQTAHWTGVQCADEIAHRLHGKPYELPVKSATDANPITAANVCFSMVGDKPEEAILVKHDFSWTGTVITGKGSVPKDAASGKFRSKNNAKATRDWYRGIMSDLFA